MTRSKIPEFVRTPEDAFLNLADYPFSPNYIDVGGLRMHYVDEGQENDRVLFLLHGQPSWSYLYRHMIPKFVEAGYRVIAPDLVGFGKSDKPVAMEAITYQAHVNWLRIFVEQLGLTRAVAFMQDWGGMIGLRVLAERQDWLSHLILANTALADITGAGKLIMPRMLKAMRFFAGRAGIEALANKQNYGNWAAYFHHHTEPDLGKVMQILTTRTLSDAELAAYRAPFPEACYYAAPRVMPQIVGADLDEAHAAWNQLRTMNTPVLTLFSDLDPFLAGRGIDKQFQTLPGAKDQPHQTISNASHFLQEDAGPELVSSMVDWLQAQDQ